MATQKWLKWFPSEWELETTPISNTMRGFWSIIKGRTINNNNNPGICSYSILEWSNILRASEREIINIFKYLHESPIEVSSEIDESASTITIKYLPIIREYNQQQKYKLNKDNRNNEKRRIKLLEYLKSIYHPQKASIQTIKSKKIFMGIMEKAANETLRKITTTPSIPKIVTQKSIKKQLLKAEKKEFIKIKNYIIMLRQSPIWERKNGRYLLGFGNFLENKEWAAPRSKPILEKDKLGGSSLEDPAMEVLKELMKDDPIPST